MKEAIIGILVVLIPQILLVLSKRGVTRKLGANFSKLLRNTLGKKLENSFEITLLDVILGARQDNPDWKEILDKIDKLLDD